MIEQLARMTNDRDGNIRRDVLSIEENVVGFAFLRSLKSHNVSVRRGDLRCGRGDGVSDEDNFGIFKDQWSVLLLLVVSGVSCSGSRCPRRIRNSCRHCSRSSNLIIIIIIIER